MTILLQGAGLQSVSVAPSGPQFSAAEIGTVSASTVAVTFDQDVSASDYKAGVTIKVNGTATSITSATRQSNHAIVYYVIPVLWHGSGDVVTWEYVGGSGNIVAESDSTPLANVSAQSVTNNCSYVAPLDLQADMISLSDGDPVSTWSDVSGNGRDFIQTGSARPTYRTGGGIPYVEIPHGGGVYLDGQNWSALDNLDHFSVITVNEFGSGSTFYAPLIYKYDRNIAVGWDTDSDYFFLLVEPDYIASLQVFYAKTGEDPTYGLKHVVTHDKLSNSELHLYIDGAEKGVLIPDGVVTTFANSAIVQIGTPFSDVDYNSLNIYAIIVYQIMDVAKWPEIRAALEARLAARYGITL